MTVDENKDPNATKTEEKKPAFEEKTSITEHKITIGDKELAYTVTAGTLILKDEDEKEGDISNVEKSGKKKSKKHKPVQIEYDPDRDITFVRKKHRRGEDGDEW